MKKRLTNNIILNLNVTFKVILVTGPRQVGKTTLLKELMPENMEYITLDDETIRLKTKSDPKGFFEEFPVILFIDFC